MVLGFQSQGSQASAELYQGNQLGKMTTAIKTELESVAEAQISASYVDLKIREMFDFVYFLKETKKDNLEEMPCIQELRVCLSHYEFMMNRLGMQMKQEVEQRLLLPWMPTNYII